MKFSTSFSLGLVATFFAVLQLATAQVTYLDNCNTATVEEDKCCSGVDSCSRVGNFTVSKGSCGGYWACLSAGEVDGYFEVGSNSCNGIKGCLSAGGTYGFAVVGSGSCNDDSSEGNACEDLGEDTESLGSVTAIIGDGSCIEARSCNAVGLWGIAKVGTNSCHGFGSCLWFARAGNGIIGDNSCHGNSACRGMGARKTWEAGSWRNFRIGHNSCNCDNCCSCLANDDAVNVPDNSCNQLEDGSNGSQCCKADGSKGSLPMSDVVNVNPTLPGGWGGAVTPIFDLEDYTLPDPVCALTSDDNVKCDFTNVVPTAGNLEYSITSFENCTGTNPDTSAIALPSEVTRATAINGTDSVTIDLTTNFVLANGASKAYTFCLLTTLKDDNGNMMIYQGQKINTTFVADGDFTVSSITSEKYEGINDETNTNTKTFGVTATRCDINRNPITSSPPLAIGATLFICIDSIDADKAVIKSVDTFGAKKGNGAFTNLLSGNTDAQGVGTAAVIIGTRPFASFFADTTPLDISGTVTLEVTENNNNNGGGDVRRLSARILQSEETDEFELQVELEAVEESSARPSTAFGVAGTALVAGAIAAVAAM